MLSHRTMASCSYTKHDGLLDGSSENTCLAKNAGKRDSVRMSYGADGQTRSHGNNTDDQSIRFQGPRRCEPIGFDRSFGLTCIVLHESLHSAAFYILVPAVFYMKDGSPLKYTDSQAVAIILIFTGVAFFLPLIGGIIGDIALGRYKAILFGTVMEFFGMVILLIYAILVYVDNTGIGPKFSIPVATFLFVTALILIALGTGFIKANVTIFGAGQLHDTSCSALKIQSYYRWYTFAINLGRLLAFCPISMFLVNYVPSDREPTGKPHRNMSVISTAVPLDEVCNKDLLAIGASILQVVFVGLGIFIFMIGKAKYKMLEPSGGHHMYYIFCFNRHDRRMSELSPYTSVYQEYRQQMNTYKRAVLRLTLLMAALLSLYTIFEAVAYQKISIFMLQFEKLSQPEGMTVHLPLPFMNTFSTLVLVVYVPLLEIFSCRRKTADDITEAEIDDKIAQWTEGGGIENTTPASVVRQASVAKYVKFGGRRKNLSSISSDFNVDALDTDFRRQVAEDISTTKHRRDILIRMGIGLICAAIAVLCAGILETLRKNHHGLSVFWQVPQYIILGIGEFGEISAYEFANTESLPGLQGFTIGMFISTYGLGNFLAYFCYAGASGSLINPKDLDDFHMEYVYYGHAAFLLLITLAFVVLARQYHLEHPCRLEEPICPYRADEEDEKFD
ncbi:uncharacterized protein LOC135486231 [Lineus longissimus]|uniref:uncharacterized protein LOC135486231 n=1 Tax=Lineus longissimus TaxID=88925 RepID=UPI002B4EF6C1